MTPIAQPIADATASEVAALAGLRETAPSDLAHSTLVAVGLADNYALIDSPVGPLRVAWNGRGLSAVESAVDDATFEARFHARTGRRARRRDALPIELARKIGRRLDGDRRNRIPLDLRGASDFERAVWMKALEIPRGEVRTYGWIAAEIGHPAAVRAVGSALRKNPVPVLIPCHRVVRSDGHVGEYALGGSDAKRAILAAEGILADDIQRMARRFRVSRGAVSGIAS